MPGARAPLTALLLPLVLAPLVAAGTADGPEIVDADGDGGHDVLDIQSAWIDVTDTQNLTFHVVLGANLTAAPKPTSACLDDPVGCSWASLTYRIVFRVLDADGKPLPTLAGYNRTYVAYRHGPEGDLAAPIGFFDDADTLAYTGTANVTVAGPQITVRVPRNDTAVNMPVGATPGTVIDQLYVYDSPQTCTPAPSPVPCSVPKPAVTAEPGVNAVHAVDEWDRAPDAGFANATRFPSPPPPAPAPAAAPSPPASPSPSPKPLPPPPPSPSTSSSTSPAADPVVQPNSDADQKAKQSPGVAPIALALGLVAVALLARRGL